MAWTMFYIEQRVLNPNKTRSEISKKIFDRIEKGQSKNYVCRLIGDYSRYLLETFFMIDEQQDELKKK